MNAIILFQPVIWAVFIVLVGFSSVPLQAQDRTADTMALMRDKIRADKKLFVAENMQLGESDAKAFWSVYDDFQKELDKQTDSSRKLIEEFAAHYETMTDAKARQLVESHMDIQTERLKLLKSYLPKFRKVLPEKKVARYYQLENKIDALIAYQLAARIPLVR